MTGRWPAWKKTIQWIAVLLLIPIAYATFLYASYIDKSITEGDAYGFSIGMTKDRVFDQIEKQYIGEKILVFGAVNNNDINIISNSEASMLNFNDLKPYDYWSLCLHGNTFNSISFTFKSGSLIEIYRHRQYFELP